MILLVKAFERGAAPTGVVGEFAIGDDSPLMEFLGSLEMVEVIVD